MGDTSRGLYDKFALTYTCVEAVREVWECHFRHHETGCVCGCAKLDRIFAATAPAEVG